MAEIYQLPKIEVNFGMVFNESEVRALDALVGYGEDAFLKVFYEKLGRAYMEPHEVGLRSLFKAVRAEVPPILMRVEKAREAFNVVVGQ